MCLLLLLSGTCAPLAAPLPVDLDADEVLALINQSRVTRGLRVLSVDSRLQQAAAAKAQDMVKRRYFSHTDPSGNLVWPFIRATGYCYDYAAENLAAGYDDEEDLHESWMRSKGHRANILSPRYEHVGIGIVRKPLMVVVLFASACS
jgi:uncharacterized protein YkwD